MTRIAIVTLALASLSFVPRAPSPATLADRALIAGFECAEEHGSMACGLCCQERLQSDGIPFRICVRTCARHHKPPSPWRFGWGR